MAGEIYHLAEKYVADNAASYDGQPDDQAIKGLANGCRRHLQNEGWNPDDYGVDLDQIAWKGLLHHRSARQI